jgi:hypothetical protein
MAREPTYAENLAAWRNERRQREIAEHVENLRAEHEDYVAERDKAIAEGRDGDAAWYDDSVQRVEAEFHEIVPRAMPPEVKRMQNYMHRKQAFIQRHGQDAIRAMDIAHNHAVQCGYTPGTGPYFKAINDRLALYAGDPQLNGAGKPLVYDEKEDALTWKEAAKISGVSPEVYAAAARKGGIPRR